METNEKELKEELDKVESKIELRTAHLEDTITVLKRKNSESVKKLEEAQKTIQKLQSEFEDL